MIGQDLVMQTRLVSNSLGLLALAFRMLELKGMCPHGPHNVDLFHFWGWGSSILHTITSPRDKPPNHMQSERLWNTSPYMDVFIKLHTSGSGISVERRRGRKSLRGNSDGWVQRKQHLSEKKKKNRTGTHMTVTACTMPNSSSQTESQHWQEEVDTKSHP